MLNLHLTKIIIIAVSLLLLSTTCISEKSENQEGDFPTNLIPDGTGVNIHFRGASQKDLALIQSAHIKIIRADLTWADIERKEGVYSFKKYDELIDGCQERDIRIMFILDYKNKIYGNEPSIKTDKQRKGFARFAKKAVERYRGRGVIWEIWNEPNIEKFWGEEPNADDYMALVEETCEAIRKVVPDALIIAPATCGCDNEFIKNCAKKGLFEFVNGISVHPYREGGPESVLNCYKSLRKFIKKYGPDKEEKIKILSSEWGWCLSFLDYKTVGKSKAELKQAIYLTRRFCIDAFAGVSCAIHYKWRENNYGLIRQNFSLKPSYTAFKVTNEQLTGYCRNISRLDIGDKEKDFIFLFEGESGKKIVAWTTEGSKTITLPSVNRIPKGVDFLGKNINLDINNQNVKVTISEEPLFIE